VDITGDLIGAFEGAVEEGVGLAVVGLAVVGLAVVGLVVVGPHVPPKDVVSSVTNSPPDLISFSL